MLDVWRKEYPEALKHITKGQTALYDELRWRTGQEQFSARNHTGAMKTLGKSEASLAGDLRRGRIE